MNLHDLIRGTRRVESDGTWDTSKDFRRKEFGQIIDINTQGVYSARHNTLSVMMYITSSTQRQRGMGNPSLYGRQVQTHHCAISFKNIEQYVYDNIQEKMQVYNDRHPEAPMASVQDFIDKALEEHPKTIPVEVGDDRVVLRTKVDLSTECAVKCTCAHFYFTFAYYCAQKKCYIGEAPASYKKHRKQRYKYNSRNRNGDVGLCKHLQLLLSFILRPDGGINGQMEYTNATINTVSATNKKLYSIEEEHLGNKLKKSIQDYEDGVYENMKSNQLRTARKEYKQFNQANREQKELNQQYSANEDYNVWE